jgi:hypothetical protein
MRIFLSYRREDSAAWAGRLHDSLASRFGERNIFQDVVAVEPGEDFGDRIEHALSEADAALAVIGPSWLSVSDARGTRRLDRPDDYVRTELAAALAHDLRVIPVLVGGATMPTPTDLPPDLSALALRQAVSIRDTNWRGDVEALVGALRGEQAHGRSRWPLIAAGAGAVLVVAGLVAVLLLRDRDDAGGDTELTGCPGPSGTGLTPVSLADAVPTSVTGGGHTLEIDVTDAHQQPDGSDWDFVATVKATNDSDTAAYHEWNFYELVVDGVQFEPWCWSLPLGENPIKEGLSNVGLVGFENLPSEPAQSDVALRVDLGGTPENIALTGAAG